MLLFLLATNSNFAKINIRAMSDIAVQDRFPFLTVELKADQDGIPIEITKENLPDEISRFLISAAERHTVFKFSKVADFYAHAPKNIKELMENSALVIIDYDKAIENGFTTFNTGVQDDLQEYLESKW